MSTVRKSSRNKEQVKKETAAQKTQPAAFDEESDVVYSWEKSSEITNSHEIKKFKSLINTDSKSLRLYRTIVLTNLDTSAHLKVSVGDGVHIASEDGDNDFYIARVEAMYASGPKSSDMSAIVSWYFKASEIPKSKLPKQLLPNEVFLCTAKAEMDVDAETIINKCHISNTPMQQNDEKTEKIYFCGKSFDGKRFKNIKEAQSGSPAPPPEKKETRREILKKSDYVVKTTMTSPVSASSVGMFDVSSAAMDILHNDDDSDAASFSDEENELEKPQLPTMMKSDEVKDVAPLKVDKRSLNVLSKKTLVVTMRKMNLATPPPDKENQPPDMVRRSSRLSDKKLVLPVKIQQTAKLSDYDSDDLSDDLNDIDAVSESSDDVTSEDDNGDDVTDEESDERLAKRPKRGKNMTSKARQLRQRNDVTSFVTKTRKKRSPHIQPRKTPLKAASSRFEKARENLHVSAVPDALPCRENEFQTIYSFIEGKISSGTGGCMYISGVPGTGKTATMTEVLSSLQRAVDDDGLEAFDYVEINGMRLTEPHQAYVSILKQLTGTKATADHAAQLLTKHFNQRGKKTTLLVVDELDLLWTKKQDVMYHIFDWPSHRHARLIVVAIANTMDLPERLMMNRVSSRLGLTRLSFLPYTFKQLQEIITTRLRGLEAFDADAVQLVARKVAAVSGDARRCLDVCRRAIEIAEKDKRSTKASASIEHVHTSLQEMFASPMVKLIRHSSTHEKIFLRSVVAEFRRSGLEEATVGLVLQHHVALAKLEGLPPPNVTSLIKVCNQLAASRVVLLETGRHDIYARIRLNVSVDDVLFALSDYAS
ncbi:unnamed protein product [Clavelina lepadiformis]|uniref:Origin recognition complex subunit 1 n=1 Tax=Clavelina lepadiformis TaxID=159417 RepID=A0ABP0F3Y5_CLALP